MAAINPIVKPLNRVVVAGDPIYYPYKAKTATNLYPKRLVTKDTTDAEIKVCGATDKPLGVAGYEQAPSPYKPADINTAYNAGDEVPVIVGGSGCIVVLTLAASQAVNTGDVLVTAADGTVAKAAAITVASGSATASAVNATTPATVGDIGEHVLVGRAMESVTTTGSTADIMVRLF